MYSANEPGLPFKSIPIPYTSSPFLNSESPEIIIPAKSPRVAGNWIRALHQCEDLIPLYCQS